MSKMGKTGAKVSAAEIQMVTLDWGFGEGVKAEKKRKKAKDDKKKLRSEIKRLRNAVGYHIAENVRITASAKEHRDDLLLKLGEAQTLQFSNEGKAQRAYERIDELLETIKKLELYNSLVGSMLLAKENSLDDLHALEQEIVRLKDKFRLAGHRVNDAMHSAMIRKKPKPKQKKKKKKKT